MREIYQHPTLLHAEDIRAICKPLAKLGISYFSRVSTDKVGNFSAICSNPAYHEFYLKNKYHYVDIHVGKFIEAGKYIVWDEIPLEGKSQQMFQNAKNFGVKHTFTIMEEDLTTQNYYHFATSQNEISTYKSYIKNIDLLESFIKYFNNSVSQSRNLSSWSDIKFIIDKESAEFRNIRNYFDMEQEIESREAFIEAIAPGPVVKLTMRQQECLFYLLRGKTAREIADVLKISPRTVELHIEHIKHKFDCYKKSHLIEKAIKLGFN